MGFVADKTVEGHNRSILICADLPNDRRHVDRAVEQFKAILFGTWIHSGSALTSTHRRKKSDIVIGREGSVPGGKLLISRIASVHQGSPSALFRTAKPSPCGTCPFVQYRREHRPSPSNCSLVQ